jgi:hypothetical protein
LLQCRQVSFQNAHHLVILGMELDV